MSDDRELFEAFYMQRFSGGWPVGACRLKPHFFDCYVTWQAARAESAKEIERLEAELQAKDKAFSIASDQALSNGHSYQVALAEIERLKRVVDFWETEYRLLAVAGVERMADLGIICDPASIMIAAANYRLSKTIAASEKGNL